MVTSARDIARSYRRLYRHGLQAVQYSAPARYVLRDEMRHAYRNNSIVDFNVERIENTVQFLCSAAREKGWAHRIVKNLIHVWWGGRTSSKLYESNPVSNGLRWFLKWLSRKPAHYRASQLEFLLRRRAYDHFNITMNMFNENFGLCLPVRDFHDIETPASLDRRLSQNHQSMV